MNNGIRNVRTSQWRPWFYGTIMTDLKSMTNEEFNIRAAKALGWSLRQHKKAGYKIWVDVNDKPIEAQNLFMDNRSYYLHEEDGLRFTASYDWAFLGVERILALDANHRRSTEHYPFRQFYSNLMNSHGYDYIGSCTVNEARVRHCFESSPEQITKAWVEVLEENE